MTNVERKVGVFFLLGLAFLLFLTILVGKIKPFRKGYYYHITFDYVAGLRVGDEVRLAGVKVGEVTDVKFSGNKIVVTVWVKRGTPIKKDSVFTIANVSIMGGKLVSISMGSPQAPFLKPGSVVKGKNPPRVEEIVDRATELGEEILATVKKVDKLISGMSTWLEENKENLTSSFRKISEVGDKFSALLTSLKELTEGVKKGEGTVGRLFKDEEMYERAKNLLAQAEKAVENISNAGKEAESMIKDWRKEVKPFLKNLKEITSRVKEGKGTVGKLLSSEEMYGEVKSTLTSTQKVMKETKEIVEKIKRVKTFWGYEGGYSWEERGMEHLGYIKIQPREGKYYLVGGGMDMWDDTPLFRAEIGKEVREGICLKGGWLGTGGGLGLELEKGKWIWEIEGAYKEDVKPFYLRGRVYYPISENLRVFLGGENLLDESFILIGIKVEFEDEDIRYLLGALSLAR